MNQTAANLISFEELCDTCTCGCKTLHRTYRHCPKCTLSNPRFDQTLYDQQMQEKLHAISRAGLDCSNHSGPGFAIGVMVLEWERCINCTAPLPAAAAYAV